MSATRHGRGAFGLTLAGFCWGLGLIVAAFLAPAYSGRSVSVGGATVSTTSTLVGENGLWVLAPVAVPAVLAAVVWFCLHRKCSRGSRTGAYLAWGCIGLLTVFSVLGAASIGMFVLPVAVLLLAAAVLTPSRA